MTKEPNRRNRLFIVWLCLQCALLLPRSATAQQCVGSIDLSRQNVSDQVFHLCTSPWQVSLFSSGYETWTNSTIIVSGNTHSLSIFVSGIALLATASSSPWLMFRNGSHVDVIITLSNVAHIELPEALQLPAPSSFISFENETVVDCLTLTIELARSIRKTPTTVIGYPPTPLCSFREGSSLIKEQGRCPRNNIVFAKVNQCVGCSFLSIEPNVSLTNVGISASHVQASGAGSGSFVLIEALPAALQQVEIILLNVTVTNMSSMVSISGGGGSVAANATTSSSTTTLSSLPSWTCVSISIRQCVDLTGLDSILQIVTAGRSTNLNGGGSGAGGSSQALTSSCDINNLVVNIEGVSGAHFTSPYGSLVTVSESVVAAFTSFLIADVSLSNVARVFSMEKGSVLHSGDVTMSNVSLALQDVTMCSGVGRSVCGLVSLTSCSLVDVAITLDQVKFSTPLVLAVDDALNIAAVLGCGAAAEDHGSILNLSNVGIALTGTSSLILAPHVVHLTGSSSTLHLAAPSTILSNLSITLSSIVFKAPAITTIVDTNAMSLVRLSNASVDLGTTATTTSISISGVAMTGAAAVIVVNCSLDALNIAVLWVNHTVRTPMVYLNAIDVAREMVITIDSVVVEESFSLLLQEEEKVAAGRVLSLINVSLGSRSTIIVNSLMGSVNTPSSLSSGFSGSVLSLSDGVTLRSGGVINVTMQYVRLVLTNTALLDILSVMSRNETNAPFAVGIVGISIDMRAVVLSVANISSYLVGVVVASHGGVTKMKFEDVSIVPQQQQQQLLQPSNDHFALFDAVIQIDVVDSGTGVFGFLLPSVPSVVVVMCTNVQVLSVSRRFIQVFTTNTTTDGVSGGSGMMSLSLFTSNTSLYLVDSCIGVASTVDANIGFQTTTLTMIGFQLDVQAVLSRFYAGAFVDVLHSSNNNNVTTLQATVRVGSIDFEACILCHLGSFFLTQLGTSTTLSFLTTPSSAVLWGCTSVLLPFVNDSSFGWCNPAAVQTQLPLDEVMRMTAMITSRSLRNPSETLPFSLRALSRVLKVSTNYSNFCQVFKSAVPTTTLSLTRMSNTLDVSSSLLRATKSRTYSTTITRSRVSVSCSAAGAAGVQHGWLSVSSTLGNPSSTFSLDRASLSTSFRVSIVTSSISKRRETRSPEISDTGAAITASISTTLVATETRRHISRSNTSTNPRTTSCTHTSTSSKASVAPTASQSPSRTVIDTKSASLPMTASRSPTRTWINTSSASLIMTATPSFAATETHRPSATVSKVVPPPATVAAALMQTSQVINAAAAVAGIVSSLAAAGGESGTLGLVSLMRCSRTAAKQTTGPLSYLLSPFVDFGFVGMVWGNIALSCVVFAVQRSLIAVFSRWRVRRMAFVQLPALCSEGSSGCSDISDDENGIPVVERDRIRFYRRYAALLRFPAVFLNVTLCFFSGTLVGAFALAVSESSLSSSHHSSSSTTSPQPGGPGGSDAAGNIVACLVGIFFVVAVTAWARYEGHTQVFPSLRFRPATIRMLPTATTPFRTWMRRLCYPVGVWRPNHLRLRYGCLFQAFRSRWLTVFCDSRQWYNVGCCVVAATSAAVENDALCWIPFTALAVWSFAFGVMYLVIQPFRYRLMNILQGGQLGLNSCIMGIMALTTVSDFQSQDDILVPLNTAMVVLIVAQSLLTVVGAVHGIWSTWLDREVLDHLSGRKHEEGELRQDAEDHEMKQQVDHVHVDSRRDDDRLLAFTEPLWFVDPESYSMDLIMFHDDETDKSMLDHSGTEQTMTNGVAGSSSSWRHALFSTRAAV